MLTFLVAIMWIVAAYAGSTLQVSYTDCTSTNSVGKLTNVVFIPAQPQINANFTAVGEVTVSETVNEGSYFIDVRDGNANPTAKGSICTPNVVKFPLNLGDIYYSGHECPIQTGATNISLTAYISSRAPDGTVTTVYTAYDKPNENGNEIFCVNITSVISG